VRLPLWTLVGPVKDHAVTASYPATTRSAIAGGVGTPLCRTQPWRSGARGEARRSEMGSEAGRGTGRAEVVGARWQEARRGETGGGKGPGRGEVGRGGGGMWKWWRGEGTRQSGARSARGRGEKRREAGTTEARASERGEVGWRGWREGGNGGEVRGTRRSGRGNKARQSEAARQGEATRRGKARARAGREGSGRRRAQRSERHSGARGQGVERQRGVDGIKQEALRRTTVNCGRKNDSVGPQSSEASYMDSPARETGQPGSIS
jgi:hypothetical protein